MGIRSIQEIIMYGQLYVMKTDKISNSQKLLESKSYCKTASDRCWNQMSGPADVSADTTNMKQKYGNLVYRIHRL